MRASILPENDKAIKLIILFNGFLSDSVEISLCEYTKTTIHLKLR